MVGLATDERGPLITFFVAPGPLHGTPLYKWMFYQNCLAVPICSVKSPNKILGGS